MYVPDNNDAYEYSEAEKERINRIHRIELLKEKLEDIEDERITGSGKAGSRKD